MDNHLWFEGIALEAAGEASLVGTMDAARTAGIVQIYPTIAVIIEAVIADSRRLAVVISIETIGIGSINKEIRVVVHVVIALR